MNIRTAALRSAIHEALIDGFALYLPEASDFAWERSNNITGWVELRERGDGDLFEQLRQSIGLVRNYTDTLGSKDSTEAIKRITAAAHVAIHHWNNENGSALYLGV